MSSIASDSSSASEQPPAIRLADLATGQPAVIATMLEPGALGERLMELGLTLGTTVEVLRRGAFGDPLQLKVRGFLLSLRRRQAQSIHVRPLCP